MKINAKKTKINKDLELFTNFNSPFNIHKNSSPQTQRININTNYHPIKPELLHLVPSRNMIYNKPRKYKSVDNSFNMNRDDTNLDIELDAVSKIIPLDANINFDYDTKKIKRTNSCEASKFKNIEPLVMENKPNDKKCKIYEEEISKLKKANQILQKENMDFKVKLYGSKKNILLDKTKSNQGKMRKEIDILRDKIKKLEEDLKKKDEVISQYLKKKKGYKYYKVSKALTFSVFSRNKNYNRKNITYVRKQIYKIENNVSFAYYQQKKGEQGEGEEELEEEVNDFNYSETISNNNNFLKDGPLDIIEFNQLGNNEEKEKEKAKEEEKENEEEKAKEEEKENEEEKEEEGKGKSEENERDEVEINFNKSTIKSTKEISKKESPDAETNSNNFFDDFPLETKEEAYNTRNSSSCQNNPQTIHKEKSSLIMTVLNDEFSSLLFGSITNNNQPKIKKHNSVEKLNTTSIGIQQKIPQTEKNNNSNKFLKYIKRK